MMKTIGYFIKDNKIKKEEIPKLSKKAIEVLENKRVNLNHKIVDKDKFKEINLNENFFNSKD